MQVNPDDLARHHHHNIHHRMTKPIFHSSESAGILQPIFNTSIIDRMAELQTAGPTIVKTRLSCKLY